MRTREKPRVTYHLFNCLHCGEGCATEKEMLRHCKQALKEERREQRRLMNLGGGRRGQSASVAVASEIRPISEVTGKRKRGRPSLKEAAAKSRRLPLPTTITTTITPTLSTISNNNRNDSSNTSAASSSKYKYKEESTGEENENTDTEEEGSLEMDFDYVEDIEEEGFKEEEEAKPDELLSPTTGSDQSNNKNSNHPIQAILSKAIPSTSSSSSTSSAVTSTITPAPPRPIVFAVKSTAAAPTQRTRTLSTQTLLSLLNTVSTGTQTSPSKRRRSSSEVSAGEEEGERSPMGSPSPPPPPSSPSTPSPLNSKPLMTRTLAYSEKFKRCSECSFRFRADLLRAHYHEAHGDLRVRCAALPTCTVRFATEAAMLAHSAAIHIACTGCRTVFLNRSELQYHKSMGCYQKGSPNAPTPSAPAAQAVNLFVATKSIPVSKTSNSNSSSSSSGSISSLTSTSTLSPTERSLSQSSAAVAAASAAATVDQASAPNQGPTTTIELVSSSSNSSSEDDRK
ncbi:hypothetical protein TYRP_003647 [Tyrophagus putrescentiae]|nr:hypothetical protein TYRP_003647 [Tyrophagus putrescentiae]